MRHYPEAPAVSQSDRGGDASVLPSHQHRLHRPTLPRKEVDHYKELKLVGGESDDG